MGSDLYMNPPRPPKPDTQKIRIDADGKTVTRLRFADKAQLWQLTSDTITVKVPGGKYWMGIGLPQGYAPAKFVVYRIVEGSYTPLTPTYEVTVLAEFPVQKESKKA
jgi:hypothetical protein